MNCQGRDTNTVLTNLSNYLTVVSDQPYNERKLQRHGLPALRSSSNTTNPARRGLRPLHKTTLNLSAGGDDSKFTSTMKDSFSGKTKLHPVKQCRKCPSMHTTQFNVGVGSHFFANTTNNDCFKDHTGQTTAVHTDRARWVNQMSGKDMLDCTQHKDSRTVDFSTTYSQNHRKLESYPSQPDNFNGRWRTSIYKVCNVLGNLNNSREFHSVSGNKILYAARNQSELSGFLY